MNEITNIEELMRTEQDAAVIEGLICIQLVTGIVSTGNMDLIKALDNGRG